MEITVFGYNVRVFIVILCLIFSAFIGANMFCSCAGGIKEGFQVGSNIVGSALNYRISDGNKSSWEKQSDVNTTYNDWYKSLEVNTGGSVPLPEGELLIFDQNKFDPSCCPSAYSNSLGCVCASSEQMQYLNERGGNRTYQDEF